MDNFVVRYQSTTLSKLNHAVNTSASAIQVYPQAWNQPRLQAPSDDDDAGVVCIPAKAGDAVVFLSK